MNPETLTLYAITDRSWLQGRSLAQDVEQAILGGSTIIQIREKNISDDEYIKRASEILPVCQKYNIPLIINDRVSVAKALGCGVHLGASDGDIKQAREILGKDAIIGATAKTIETAKLAEESGADYIGSGAVFGSETKTDAKPMNLEFFAEICKSVNIPVVAIGGINQNNAFKLKNTGLAGICAVSGIFAQQDIKKATQNLYKIAQEVTAK
ncbi:MAG TPA: thiamine phosphate synthase [Candidatus Butyricicoccus avistercoris]|uniref:Thiamine-phosphate synthase n=1 Tax=Candidatus Butyricicoccus avistercoris TaxID=2838518 RepID=A0A9D1PHU7_9FIRM|nr:thiamine phosphate synthase [Candidatus Butyricicoccus avistercoris]